MIGRSVGRLAGWLACLLANSLLVSNNPSIAREYKNVQVAPLSTQCGGVAMRHNSDTSASHTFDSAKFSHHLFYSFTTGRQIVCLSAGEFRGPVFESYFCLLPQNTIQGHRWQLTLCECTNTIHSVIKASSASKMRLGETTCIGCGRRLGSSTQLKLSDSRNDKSLYVFTQRTRTVILAAVG